jgi:hypothetical protein
MIGLFTRFLTVAGVMTVLASGAMAQGAATEPRLQFELTPYIWMPTIDLRADSQLRNGTVVTTNLSIGAGEYLTKLNFAGMLAAGARYERFSLITDFMYLNANSDSTGIRSVSSPILSRPITDTLYTSTRLQTTIWTLAGGYAVAEGDWGQVDVIGGLRLLALDQTVNYSLARDVTTPGGTVVLGRSGNLSANGTVWNGIAGIRGRVKVPESDFYVPFYFDIGGGGSVWTWQAYLGVGYSTKWADISVGYRYLSFQQSGNAILEKLNMGGPIAAATFRF